uniref:Cilia- and flagella-associated protein 69 ARM repeats domain-containing protein n=1 Tax=Amphiprion percula TaxID=161767 RepID=A0A3P8TJK8_AMPPE
ELPSVAKILNICAEKVKDHPEYGAVLSCKFYSQSVLVSQLHDCISFSDMNCASILRARGAETICLHMNEPDPSGQVLFRSSEILWNLLERSSKQEVTAQLCSMECVVSLKEAFFHQLLNTSQHLDLQLRNDLLVMTSFIAENPNSLLVLYKEERVMLALLTLVKPPAASSERRSGSRGWSAVQQEELQLQALAALAAIAPLMMDDYMSCQGNTCLLLLLDWCVGPDSYFGQGHSFHSSGGRGSKRAQMRRCIRVLRSVTSLGEESVNQDLCDQGIISQLLGILIQMDASPDEEDIVSLEMKSDIQLILAVLCDTDMHRKDLFGSEGVEMTVNFLKKGSDKFYSGLGHNKLILSTVDCVWSNFLTKFGGFFCRFLGFFSDKETIFFGLVNEDNRGPRCVHGMVLATLLELCDNPNTVSHILDWRDGGGQTASRLLLQLWRDEEEELGLKRNQHGGITGPSAASTCNRTPKEELFQLTNSFIYSFLQSYLIKATSIIILEISENLRSKIYSIFCKLGLQELPGLSTKDYVTLSIVRRYLDFKVGEVWDEMGRELSLDGVRPISPDQEALNAICRMTEDTARRIMTEQSSIVEQQQKEEISEEQLLYTEIKSHWKQRELMAKSWEDYVARTSNYEILKVYTLKPQILPRINLNIFVLS